MQFKVTMDNIDVDLLCDKCKLPLSISPVTLSSGRTFCGRCPTENGIHLTIYECLAKSRNFPCRYSNEGCSFRDKFDKIALHEDICKKQDNTCLIQECQNKRYDIEDTLNHWQNHHKNIILSKTVFDINSTNNFFNIFMYIERNTGILFLAKVVDNSLLFCATHAGLVTDETEQKYSTYNLTIASEDCEHSFCYKGLIVRPPCNRLFPFMNFGKQILEFVLKDSSVIKLCVAFTHNHRYEVNCGKCGNSLQTTVKMCEVHNFCEDCALRMNDCSICNSEKNEAIVGTKQKPVFYVNLQNELIYDCPLINITKCQIQLKLPEMYTHFLTSHKQHFHSRLDVVTVQKNAVPVTYYFVQHNNIFKCYFHFDYRLYINVMVLGKNSEGFTFSVEFSRAERQMILTEPVEQYSIKSQEEILKNSLTVVPRILLPYYSNNFVSFKFVIHKP